MALIFVVEDNFDIQQAIKELLILHSYNVKCFNNGKEVFDHIIRADQLPSLIISDIMMPIMDGITMKSEIDNHLDDRSIPFIFMSAKSDPDIMEKTKKIGVVSYLVKPFRAVHLLDAVNENINNS